MEIRKNSVPLQKKQQNQSNMKTTNTFKTLAQALKAIAALGESYATIADCNYIKTDNEIDCNAIRKDFEAFKLNGMLSKKNPFFSDSYPYTYYMAIRENGQEGGTNKEQVLARIRTFGGALAAIKLTYNGESYTVAHKTI